jgi:spermidine synthase
LTLSELSDPRVRVEHVDGRLLVRRKKWGIASQPKEGYDLVIVNLPYPSTLQLNRFYTVEFFQMVRGLLAEEGILVIGCPGTLTYMSDELRHLNTMAYHTLQQTFPYVRPIPGDVTLWLASPSDALSTVPVEALVERWEERGLETQLLTAPHIRLRLGQTRLDWFWTSLGKEEDGGKAIVNRDLHPVGLFYGLSYWNALFSPHLARVFAFTGRLNLWALSVPIIGCALLFLAVVKLTAKGRGACPELVLSPSTTLRINSVGGRSRRAIIPIAIATTGFTGMTADLIIVFAFQTLYGYVYHWIGLLITAFMAGLSLGGLLMTRRLAAPPILSPALALSRVEGCRGDRGGERSTLLKLELAIVLYWALLPIALSTLYSRITHPLVFTSIQGILLFLNALAGFLVGSQFPLANRMWLKGREDSRGTAGVLYACDLVGAFLGSIVVSVVLIPVLGILETCLLAAALKLGSLLLVSTAPSLLSTSLKE